MHILYHLWLSPFCRSVRITLGEKQVEYQLQAENIWDRRPEFLAINPAGEVPVLIEERGTAISGGATICEYLDETYPTPPLMGDNAIMRAEIRRLIHWFDRKFNDEVTEHLLGEKMMKRFLGLGEPDAAAIRAGYKNFRTHLDYITYLIERRNWIAGEEFSIADIAAAAQLSVLDYIAEVPWEEYEEVKTWYARMKSRPSFRPILSDYISSAPPPNHYANLDF